jgi:hypothetical protein
MEDTSQLLKIWMRQQILKKAWWVLQWSCPWLTWVLMPFALQSGSLGNLTLSSQAVHPFLGHPLSLVKAEGSSTADQSVQHIRRSKRSALGLIGNSWVAFTIAWLVVTSFVLVEHICHSLISSWWVIPTPCHICLQLLMLDNPSNTDGQPLD